MTPQEITAFAAKVNNDREFAGRHVRIWREHGGRRLYLRIGGWTPDKHGAQVYDYDRAGVGRQLALVREQYGATWHAEAVEEAAHD